MQKSDAARPGAGMQAQKPRHRLFIFSFDDVLVDGSSTKRVMDAFGMDNELGALRALYNSGRMSGKKLVESIAGCLKGKNVRDFDRAAYSLRPKQHTIGELRKLKKMGCTLAVISFSFHRAISAALPQGLFDFMIAPKLRTRNGLFTGEVSIPFYRSGKYLFSKRAAAVSIMKALGVKPEESIAVGEFRSDRELYSAVGAAVDVSSSEPSPLSGISSMA